MKKRYENLKEKFIHKKDFILRNLFYYYTCIKKINFFSQLKGE